MKKIHFLEITFFVFVFAIPVFSQDPALEQMPVESLTLKKGNIPVSVMKNAEQLFQGNTQVKWGVFPYELKDYDWTIDKEYNDPIDHYEIQFKAKDGSDIFAVFESTGELISSRIINKNAPVPPSIMRSIEKSEYKDWKVVGDVMLIKNYQRQRIDYYTVRLEKGNQKKTLHFTTKGEIASFK